MSIRSKTRLVLALTILLVMIAVFLFSRIILLNSFAKLDEERARVNVQRAVSALENQLSQMDAVNRDWAFWDDTYNFVLDRNEEYIQINLLDETFQNLHLNLMAFTGSAGDVVFAKAYDLENGRETDLPEDFEKHVSRVSNYVLSQANSNGVKGILLLSEGPMLIVANLILTSQQTGPPRGIFVSGRYLDATAIEALGRQTLVSLDIASFNGGRPLPNSEEALDKILRDEIFVTALSSQSLCAYYLLRDIYGEPALVVKVDMPRTIYHQGLTTINYFFTSLIVAILLISVLAYFLIDKVILARLAKLNSMVGDIGTRGDFSAHLSLPGNDELSNLARVMNTTLEELAKHHQALADSEQKYSTLIERSNDGIVVVQDGLIKFANQKAIEMGGFSGEETIGKPFLAFISPEYQELVIDSYNRRMAGEKVPERYEIQVLSKDGRKIPVEVNASTIQYEGRPAEMAIIRDMSERKRMQEQLIMTERLAMTGELASGVAHELNNPLTSINGFLQLLLERDDLSDEVKEGLRFIGREADRAARVVRNLLTFARKRPPTKQLSQVNDIIEDVLRLRAYEHRMSNIQVEKRLAPNLPEIMVDRSQMQQVFLNIVLNAEYFMVESHSGGRLVVTTEKPSDFVRISFADDGPGIPKEILPRIFDPFFTTKGAGRGTGLGLSICQSIVIEHGGRIYAESEPGKGATFIVELPIKDVS